MQFGVLLQVLCWDAVWGAVGGASDGAGARLTAGCCLGRSSGGAVGGAGVQSLLSGSMRCIYSFTLEVTASVQTTPCSNSNQKQAYVLDLRSPRSGA